MPINLPTLSTGGFVKDPAQVLDTLLSYFFVADYSQSNAHYGKVSSLPYIIKDKSNDISGLKRSVESALDTLLSGYFDSINIDVTVEQKNRDAESYDIQLAGTVTLDGKSYGIAKLLSVANDSLIKTANLTNNA